MSSLFHLVKPPRAALAAMLLAALSVGAPSFAADKVDAVDADGTTPLHWAVFNGDVAKVDALIKAHADVNARNRFGSTPLYEAALAGNTEIIKRLLKAKAGPNAPTKVA